jgi:phospholipid/cholesterol/gamma-HCH transport system permease protein
MSSQAAAMVADALAGVGRRALDILSEMGALALFLLHGLATVFRAPFRPYRTLDQVNFIGMKSLFIVCLTGLFTGMVLGLQGYYTLVKFGSEALLGAAVALSLIRELGPVLTALMITGRAGSSMAAELGIMRISEQIDALETMNIDPVRYLVGPRLVAALISFPLLTAVFDVVGIVGGYLTGVKMLGMSAGTYFSSMDKSVGMEDVRAGFLKAFVFALVVGVVCCYQGFTVHRRKDGFGARGVSYATTSAVVLSSVLVLVADYVLTSFLL